MKPALGGIIAFAVAALVIVAAAATRPAPEEDSRPASAFGGAFEPLDAQTVARGLDAPTWEVGHTWFIMFPEGDAPCVVTVVDVSVDNYTQAMGCPEGDVLARDDAVFDLPHLGQITTALAGVSGEGSVDFFSWPLTDGKSWETEWFGTSLTITATFDEDIEGPRGDEPGYRLEAVADGERAFDYNYLPSIGWWSELDFDADFSGLADIEVVGFDPTFEGIAWSSKGSAVYHFSGSLPPIGTQPFAIPDGTSVVAFRAAASGGDFLASIVVQDPQQARGFQQASGVYRQYVPAEAAFIEYLDGVSGQWAFSVEGAGVVELLYEFIAIELTEWGGEEP